MKKEWGYIGKVKDGADLKCTCGAIFGQSWGKKFVKINVPPDEMYISDHQGEVRTYFDCPECGRGLFINRALTGVKWLGDER